jgi:hypothetical protein
VAFATMLFALETIVIGVVSLPVVVLLAPLMLFFDFI